MRSDDIEAFVDVAVRLRQCLDRAWKELMDLPPLAVLPLSTAGKARFVHDHWTAIIQEEFSGDDWSRFTEERGLKQLTSDFVRIRFKKVDRRWLVAKSRTRQSRSWI